MMCARSHACVSDKSLKSDLGVDIFVRDRAFSNYLRLLPATANAGANRRQFAFWLMGKFKSFSLMTLEARQSFFLPNICSQGV